MSQPDRQSRIDQLVMERWMGIDGRRITEEHPDIESRMEAGEAGSGVGAPSMAALNVASAPIAAPVVAPAAASSAAASSSAASPAAPPSAVPAVQWQQVAQQQHAAHVQEYARECLRGCGVCVGSFCNACCRGLASCFRGMYAAVSTFRTEKKYENHRIGVIGALILAIILLIIILPFAFVRVDWNQFGLRKQLGTNEVFPTVLYPGNHHVGVGDKVILFDSTNNNFTFIEEIDVFERTGFEITIGQLVVWVRLRDDTLFELWSRYLTAYQAYIRNTIIAATKGEAAKFSVDDLVNNRGVVEAAICAEIVSKLSDFFIVDPGGCQFHNFILPPKVAERNLNQLLQQPITATSMAIQNRDFVLQETALQVGAIEAQQRLIGIEASAKSDRIISEAKSRATARLLRAKQEGLNYMFTAMGADAGAKAMLLKYLSLSANPSAVIYDGFVPQQVLSV